MPIFKMRCFTQSRQFTDWFLVGIVVSSLILLTCSQTKADPASKECGERQHKCICGIPRCIEPELVKNGVQDCQDGSDEGQWDPSKCAIKNNTSENIRFRRAALSELSRVTNLGATTTFFGGDRGRTRPVGLLTTTMGSFVTAGTTTEYITKVLATYIKGTYARVISTSSRIYHAIEATEGGDMLDLIKPTGFIASTVSNEINGYATTAHTTDFYRTYIDGTYAQLVSSYSDVHYPPWYTDKIIATAVGNSHGEANTGSVFDAGAIYATPVAEVKHLESAYLFEENNAAGGRVKTVIVPTRVASESRSTLLPEELRGHFDSSGKNIVAEVGLIENENRLRAFRPNNNKDTEVKVTGTHGKFVHTDSPTGDQTTYNVFTGTYIQNMKTFLFFFGNTVIEASKSLGMSPQTAIHVENGPTNGKNVVLDMSHDLKVIVPANNERITVHGSIEGQNMPGVLVEVEIEPSSELEDLITVDGARQTTDGSTPSDPRIDQVVLTLGNMPSNLPRFMDENEIPRGRKAPGNVNSIAPTQVLPPASLPTFTVGQEQEQYDSPSYEAITSSESKEQQQRHQSPEEDTVVTSSVKTTSKKNSAPVFQRPTPKPAPRLPALLAIVPKQPAPQSYRSNRAFVDLLNSEADNDLQSAASTGRATVTYVGFADFTTTVGNTVIVFTPRTKIIEDMRIQASMSRTPTVEPTRFVYSTTTEREIDLSEEPSAETAATSPAPPPTKDTTTTEETTTTTTTTQRTTTKEPKEDITTTTPTQKVHESPEDVEDEITTELAPSETTVLVSGTQTVFANLDESPDSRVIPQQKQESRTVTYATVLATPQLPSQSPSPSPSPSPPSRKTLFQPQSRSRFFPKNPKFGTSSTSQLSPEATPALPRSSDVTTIHQVPSFPTPTATTAVYQTDKVNPTGLVTSIGRSVVKDKTTTVFTSLIYGTFIGESYAQIIKSTSSVIIPGVSRAVDRSSLFTSIRPTKISKFTKPSTIINYEVTTTEPAEEEETTTTEPIKVETSTSSTTSTSTESTTRKSQQQQQLLQKLQKQKAASEEEAATTVKAPEDRSPEDDSQYDEITTTMRSTTSSSSESSTRGTKDDEHENEIEQGRRVVGRPHEQQLVNLERPDSAQTELESSQAPEPDSDSATDSDDSEQTIFITRTLPTTLYRTYTYFTTYFLPQDDTTITSVTSREITSTAVGLVKKTFANVVPSSSSSAAISPSQAHENKGGVRASKNSSENTTEEEYEDDIEPTSAQVVYKTFFTTYTYLTTYFTGQTSSVASREEIISNVVTMTQGGGSKSGSAPTSSPVIASSNSPSSSIKIAPSSSSSQLSSSLKTKASLIRPSASRSGKFSVIRRSKILSKTPELTPSSSSAVEEPAPVSASPASEQEPSEEIEATASQDLGSSTIFKTFYTTYTYFTTLFNGQDTSIQSRTEVLTNIVPTVTKASEPVTAAPSSPESYEYEEERETEEDVTSPVPYGKETTFYTTYTYLTTSFKEGTSIIKSSLATYTKVVIGDNVLRSGVVDTGSSIEPTKISGRNVPRPSATVTVGGRQAHAIQDDDDDTSDLNEVGSHLSERSETTLSTIDDKPEVTTEASNPEYYELDGSEGTTLRPSSNEQEESQQSSDSEADDNELNATPALKTYFTTFTFYTTHYKGGSSTVESRLETVTNIASDTIEDASTDSVETAGGALVSAEPTYPITYYTTYTYWTTSFHDGTPLVTSREETVSNVVTPGVDDAAPTSISKSDTENQIQPTATVADVELTTYFTTYTYYTTSYVKDETIVTSRLETVTNVLSGSASVSPDAASPSSATPAIAGGRAIGSGSVKPEIVSNDQQQADDDYDLPTGLLSTIISSEVVDLTTTIHSTDVYGTYIDGIYAQVLESTSELIRPTASAETVFLNEPSATPTGLLSVNEGKTVDADGSGATFYTTKVYGSIIDGQYAQLIERASSISRNPTAALEDSENPLKTGLVRIVDGSLVQGEQTTFYTSKILGTFIDNQYAQVIESTSRYVINPTKSDEFTTTSPTKLVDIEGSEETTEEIPTTTEREQELEKEEEKAGGVKPGRFGPGRNRNGGSSRLSFTASSKSFTPLITPFASRSRPAFAPRRRQSSAIVVSRTDVTPTVTATLAAGTSAASGRQPGSTFANRRKPAFGANKASDVEVTTQATVSSTAAGGNQEATPRLPFGSASRSRFQRPSSPGTGRSSTSGASISPTSSSRGISGSSPSGSSSRGRGFTSRGASSFTGARRGPTSSASSRPGATATGISSAGARGSVSSRFNPRGRSTSIQPTATQVTTVKPTETQVSPQEEEYEIIEYEYEEPVGSSSTTTEAPKSTTSASRFSGGSRFRLNPKLPIKSNPSATSTNAPVRTTTQRSLPLLRKNIFTRPTPSTRGTTTADEGDEDSAALPPATPRPTSRPSFSNNRRTTPVPSQTTTTTRRTFAPRARPAGFPSRGLVRPSTTSSTTTGKDEDQYNGELDYEESKNYPSSPSAAGNTTLQVPSPPAAAGEVVAAESIPSAVRVRAPLGFPQTRAEGYEADFVNVEDLVDSGSEFFANAVPAPYESYEYLSVSSSDESKSQDASERLSYTGSGRRVRSAPETYYPGPEEYGYRYARQVEFGNRNRGSLRSNFNSRRQVNSRSSPSYYSDYDDYYEPPSTAATPPPPPPTTTRSTSPANRFRGRIQPTSTSRRTPFTLTNSDVTNSRTPSRSGSTNSNSRAPSPSPSFTRRQQSRYQRPTEAPTTTSRTSRFHSRYRGSEAVTTPKPPSSSRGRFTSPSRSRGSTTCNDRGRYDTSCSSSKDEFTESAFAELGTITVTHYVPKETQIPYINGKNTEYKTIITPSASKEVLAPYLYTRSDYQGSPVLVFNNELTSTPSFGVTEVTRFFIRETPTTSVTFTPTTIRGRRTSFSHIVPSTVYSVEPVVSTITAPNLPLTDQNQLTNLLLNQLLGNLNLNPANLLGLQRPQGNNLMADPATPVTHFNTKTTSYVTTVTDFTSTVIPITLHGKAIKTTIVESSKHVITATEFITESTVITPAPTLQGLQAQPTLLNNGFNPALLQGLLQQQQQLLLSQQQQQQPLQQPIIPTQPPPQIVEQTQTQTLSNKNNRKDFDQEEESMKEISVEKAPVVKEAPKEEYSVVTLYVSGRNPGEFSTVLSTVPIQTKVKRSANYYEDGPGSFINDNAIHVQPTQVVDVDTLLLPPTQIYQLDPSQREEYKFPTEYYSLDTPFSNDNSYNNNNNAYTYQGDDLQDSYSLSNNNNANSNSNNNVWFKPTQSLDSVLGDVSKLLNSDNSQSVLNAQ